MAIIVNGGVNNTVFLSPPRKPGDFSTQYDLRKDGQIAYLESTLTDPINYTYGIPVMLTTATAKSMNGNRIVVKALANTPAADIVGFIAHADRDASLFLKSGAICSVFKGAEAYNRFYPFYIDDTLVSTIKAGDKLEFVPATNSYKPVNTGTPVVVATVDGGYEVEPLI